MKVQVENVSAVEKKLSIELPPERVAKALEVAYRGLAKQVKIPGFRPGKAPRRILEQRYKDQVEQDVLQILVSESWREVVASESLQPVAQPVVDPEKLEEGKPFRFAARVEVKPVVEPKNWKGLTWDVVKAEVTDSKIDDELLRIQDSLARLEPVAGRTVAQAKDFGLVDLHGLIDGKDFEGGKGEGVTLEVVPGTLLEGNAPFLEGVEVGATVEADAEFPPGYPQAELRGKVAKFKLTLKELKHKVTPALDDELAKDFSSDADTLAKLKDQIRERLQKGESEKAERETRDHAIRALITANTFEVPNAMVERAIDMMVTGAAERFARQGLDIRQLGLDFRKLREDLREKATVEVRSALLLEAIAKGEQLEVSDDEVEARYGRIAKDAGTSEEKVRQHFRRHGDELADLRARMLEDKAFDLVRAAGTPKA